LVDGNVVGWLLTVYPGAGEAGGSFRYSDRTRREGNGGGVPAEDPERSASEAARRARSKTRRYCAANRLNRLGTLTYRGGGCHDPFVLRGHVAEFFRSLRTALGGKPFPYLWTAEWHKSGHGLHVHFAVGQFVKRSLIEAAWGHGFVHIKLLGDLPVGSGVFAEARRAAGYLSKYVGKDFDTERSGGLHRYEVAQGFQPATVQVWGRTVEDAIGEACGVMGGLSPERVWNSEQTEGWQGPPAVWVSWRG
jgi:hypothetical protein